MAATESVTNAMIDSVITKTAKPAIKSKSKMCPTCGYSMGVAAKAGKK